MSIVWLGIRLRGEQAFNNATALSPGHIHLLCVNGAHQTFLVATGLQAEEWEFFEFQLKS